MSLRSRVVSLIGIVLLASVILGALLAGRHARIALGEEMRAGMSGAQRTAAGVMEELRHAPDREHALRQMISAFDGDRHVQATLYSASGAVLARSAAPTEAHLAPAWFDAMLGPRPGAARINVPLASLCCVVLTPTGRSDVAALWSEFSAVVGALLGASAVGLALVYFAIGAALAPLNVISDAFRRIGAGEYGAHVPVTGPKELIRLERDFNSMSAQLAAMRAKNHNLERQLTTLQEEERAELARDLHDEIGPYLFAVNVDAQMIVQLQGQSCSRETLEQVAAIRAAVGHMQRQIRDILGRLRPATPTELGFSSAIDDLIDFWRGRAPDVRFELSLPDSEPQVAPQVREVAYRIVQEALSNAFRHSDCSTVYLRIQPDDAHAIVVEVCNDGLREDQGHARGLGLIGMRERVNTLGGQLDAGARDGSWRVRARLPEPAQGDTCAP